MGLFQSFRQVFVTNSPALLASGSTVDSLAVGQIAILDGKTNIATTTPTYATCKAFRFVWGTPNVDLGFSNLDPNENEYSKLIKGKNIISFRAKKAQHPLTALYTVGWTGDVSDTTNTLFANANDSKNLYIKLTGTVIDRLYSGDGVVKLFKTTPPCPTDCNDNCGTINCVDFTNDLVNQINSDKDFKKFIRASALITCNPTIAPSTTTCYKFSINVCDTGDAAALGLIQAAYPGVVITNDGRQGSISTYSTIKTANSAPSNFTSGQTVVTNCTSCPSGYTYTASANSFEIRVVSGASLPTITGVISHTQLNADPAFDTYNVLVATTTAINTVLALAGEGVTVTYVGVSRGLCVLTSPPSVAWYANGTLVQITKGYTITLADTECGTSRLTELQAAYPTLTITQVSGSGSCVHSYAVTISSACFDNGCFPDQPIFADLAPYQGVEWTEVVTAIPSTTVCQCGIQIESAFFNRTTNECTFDAFPYENDTVYVQASNYNPDFNSDSCEPSWKFTQIRQVRYPQGTGAAIQWAEKESKSYDLRERSYDAVLRQIEGYVFQAQTGVYYDEYTLRYKVDFKTSGGWAENYSETIEQVIYVPEGTGKPFEAAINGYLTSAGIQEDGATI